LENVVAGTGMFLLDRGSTLMFFFKGKNFCGKWRRVYETGHLYDSPRWNALHKMASAGFSKAEMPLALDHSRGSGNEQRFD
jgi:hypothetical protein